MAYVSPDTVTVLAGSLPACKRVTPDRIVPAARETWFQADQAQVSSLQELAALLELVAREPRAFLVRGLPRAERIRRTHVGPDAFLDDTPHQWLALDLDSVKPDLRAQDFARDVPGWASWARDQLPACWRRAACWYQATGSAGIKPGIRLRLVFWLDRSLTSPQAKTLVRALPVQADLALYTPSQPHYTSPPLFEGVPDPIPGARSGLLSGDPCVLLEDGPDLGPQLLLLARSKEGERRNTLNKIGFALARTTDMPEARLEQELVQASVRSGLPEPEARLTAQNAIRDGRAKRLADLDGWRGQLVRGKTGDPVPCHANAVLYLLYHPAFAGRLVSDGTRVLWLSAPPWDQEPRPLRDTDVQELLLWFQQEAGLAMRLDWCQGALELVASRNQVCPVQEYLASLPEWDGQARMDSFFIRHWGVEDTRLHRAQARIWFVQAAQRAWATLEKPVMARYVPILHGAQGLRKSLGLAALCARPEWFRDLVPDLRDKDSSLAMLDSWIVELAELTHRRADQDVFKAFVTRSVEKFRPPYGRATILAPRRCALIGTCNESTFLSDDTGNTRFWPMHVTRRAELEPIQAERDQLWAEAQAHMDEQTWLPDELEVLAIEAQEASRDTSPVDVIQERVLQCLHDPRWTPDPSLVQDGDAPDGILTLVSFRLVCAMAGLDPIKAGPTVGRAMSRLGWTKTRTRFGSGRKTNPLNRWLVPEDLRRVLRVPGQEQARA